MILTACLLDNISAKSR